MSESTDDPGEPSGQWRVFSDGTPRGTRVFSPLGEDVTSQIREVNFNIDAGTGSVGELNLVVNVAGFVTMSGSPIIEHKCVGCGELLEHKCGGPPF